MARKREPMKDKQRFFCRVIRTKTNKDFATLSFRSHVTGHSAEPFSLDSAYLLVGKRRVPCNFQSAYSQNAKKRDHSFTLSFSISESTLCELPIHNTLSLCCDEQKMEYLLAYSFFLPKYMAARTKYYHMSSSSLVAYFRQTIGKNVSLCVRHANVTDKPKANIKLFFAWLVSKVPFVSAFPVLLFEKNCQHYEESGKVVFERLVDLGYSQVRFVLNDQALSRYSISQNYRKQILVQHSFAHYLAFFRSRVFIGSELLAHSLELRCQNLLVQRKLKSKKNTFVFLQHGVSYMVSLDSPARSPFRKLNMKGRSLIVASSEIEACHFTECAGFSQDDLIVCGMPKFDCAYLNPHPKKILVMPTWRIWEFNKVKRCPEDTKYYQMIQRIVRAIPDYLQDRVVVFPHPLFDPSIFGEAAPQTGKSIDDLLRDVDVLITDYSSISYDAFFRGSKVVFYWEEKDECMDHYGSLTRLMLTEDSAFGPVCYCPDDLGRVLPNMVDVPQERRYQERFGMIVEYSDRQNTKRLIDELVKRRIL